MFAVSILVNLGLTTAGAAALFTLFAVQLTASITMSPQFNQVLILVLSALSAVLAVGQLVRRRRDLVQVVRDGVARPFSELEHRDT